MLLVENLSKTYDGVHALTQAGCTLAQGETLVISGPSGSGKTTLLRLLAGLELPDSGQVFLQEQLVSKPGWISPPHLRGIGMVFQRSTLWPHMTVSRNIRFGLHSLEAEEAAVRVWQLLEGAGVENLAGRYPSQLSGGEARRVEILRALAPRPQLLLMDEPLTSLDPGNKERLLHFIRDLVQEAGLSMIYVTHDREEAAFFAARRMRMEEGRLLS